MPYPPTTTPLSPSNPVVCSIVSPLPVPTYGQFGTFTVLTKAIIYPPAPPPTPTNPQETTTSEKPSTNPIRTITNTTTWTDWNRFTPSCTFLPTSPHPGPILKVGTVFDMDVFMSGDGLVEGKKRSNGNLEVVTVLEEFVGGEGEKGERLAWKSNQYPEWLLRCERVLECVEFEDEEGRKGWVYTSWETFGGPLAIMVKLAVGSTLVERLGDYGRDIKAFIESGGDVEGGASVVGGEPAASEE